MKFNFLLSFILTAFFYTPLFSQLTKNNLLPPALSSITEADLKKDLYEMAGDYFRG